MDDLKDRLLITILQYKIDNEKPSKKELSQLLATIIEHLGYQAHYFIASGSNDNYHIVIEDKR